jgi:hypothetical protein
MNLGTDIKNRKRYLEDKKKKESETSTVGIYVIKTDLIVLLVIHGI